MRRVLALLGILGAAAMAVSSCGVIADDNAATVQGVGVPTATVDALARDKALSGLNGGTSSVGKSVMSGEVARSALIVSMQTVALEQLADSIGVSVQQDPSLLTRQLSQNGQSAGDFAATTRSVLVRQLSAFAALTKWYGALDLSKPRDVKKVYDLAPGLWDRYCVSVLAAQTAKPDAVVGALGSGVFIEDVPKRVKGTAVALKRTSCVTFYDLLNQSIPGAVTQAVLDAPEGKVIGPIDVQGTSVWVRVDTTERGTREQAAKAMTDSQSTFDPSIIMAYNLLTDSEVNPRYGTKVEVAQGLVVGAPESPAPAAGATPTTTAGSGSATP